MRNLEPEAHARAIEIANSPLDHGKVIRVAMTKAKERPAGGG
jgi:uncharacterized protein YdaT